MQRVVGIVIVVVIALVVRYFTVDQNEVLKFNDGTVNILNAHGDPFLRLIDSTSTYLGQEQADIASMRQQLAAARSDVATMKDELNKLSVPDDELCKKFHASVLALVATNENMCTSFDEMISFMEARNPGSDADIEQATNMLVAIAASMETSSSALLSAQQTMAAKYKITLGP